MTTFDLPTTLEVDGEEKAIYCDFRDVLVIMDAYMQPDLSPQEKAYILLNNLFVDDFRTFRDVEGAVKVAGWFLDGGKEYSQPAAEGQKLLDWSQDFPLIIAAVNKTAGREVREAPFLHWWTFLGFFAERGECQLSTIMGIREKMAKGESLDKWERQVLRENQDLIQIKAAGDDDFEKMLGW